MGIGATPAVDVSLLSQYLAGSQANLPFGRESGDINADGRVDVLDVLQVARSVTRLQ